MTIDQVYLLNDKIIFNWQNRKNAFFVERILMEEVIYEDIYGLFIEPN